MKRLRIHIALLLICAALVAVGVMLVVDEVGVRVWGFKWHIHHLLHNGIGDGCAMCRTVRSFVAVGHGQFVKAFQYHWLGVVVFVFLLYEIGYQMCAIVKHPKRLSLKTRRIHIASVVCLIGAIAAVVFI